MATTPIVSLTLPRAAWASTSKTRLPDLRLAIFSASCTASSVRFNFSKLLVDPYAKSLSGDVDWKQPIFPYELASGDPLFFGVGGLIVMKVGAEHVELLSQPSAGVVFCDVMYLPHTEARLLEAAEAGIRRRFELETKLEFATWAQLEITKHEAKLPGKL